MLQITEPEQVILLLLTIINPLKFIIMTLEEIAYENGLDLIETTSEMNGYPRNLRKAIIGFETFDEAQKLADMYDLTVQEFTRRDGWQFWVREGKMWEEYDYAQIRKEFDGANTDIKVYSTGEEDDVMEELKYFLGICEDLDEMRHFINNTEKVLNALNGCEDNQFVLTSFGELEGVYDRKVMSFSYDTHNYVIGIGE